jgi:phosphonate ABC transporter permease subunit PhnE
MESSATLPVRAKNPSLAALLSLVVPGAGQFYAKSRGRGVVVFAAAAVLAYLVNWGLDSFKIGALQIGGVSTSWLWLLLAFFWLWNIVDANRIAQGLRTATWLGLVLAAVILYALAWDVTDVNPDRLISRFTDATRMMNELIHPDLVTHDPATGALSPSDNFGDIFGKIEQKPAPEILTTLGLTQKDQEIPAFQAGSLVETIAIGLLATIFGTLLAIPISFFAAHNIMSRLRGGTVIYYAMRTFLNIVRAVDPIIWGLLIVVWVGLGSFAGILALTVHTIAALGKLYSEEIEHIDPGPVEAVTATGANLLQVVRYAVVPQIIPPFLGYTLLRWDINMRMATIIGFVAGGGIGFFVLETIRKGAYDQYAAALWAVAIVIIAVDYISSALRARILTGETKISEQAPKPFYRTWRGIVLAVLGILVFLYCWNVTGIDLRTMFEPAPTFIKLVRDFVSIDLTPDLFDTVLKQIIITVFQAMLATTLGGLVAIPFSFLAARNLTGRSRLSMWIYYLTRFLFNVLRSIEALLYVAIFVFWVGIGPFAGMMALAITTFALIGKLFAEAIENIDAGPTEALTATGATRLQTIVYAIIPQIVPPFVSYSIYQWDINVRMATIIGFAGGGGIGLLLNTYFGELQYHKAGTVVAIIIIVVALLDFASAKIREQMV